MSVTVQWDNDAKTVLRYEVAGRWTWDEFYVAYDQGKSMMEAVPHTVHFIMVPMDFLTRNYLPPGALTHISSIYRRAAPNSGMTINVGGGGFARAMLNVLGRVSPKIAQKFAFADSLEEARTILAKAVVDNAQTTGTIPKKP